MKQRVKVVLTESIALDRKSGSTSWVLLEGTPSRKRAKPKPKPKAKRKAKGLQVATEDVGDFLMGGHIVSEGRDKEKPDDGDKTTDEDEDEDEEDTEEEEERCRCEEEDDEDDDTEEEDDEDDEDDVNEQVKRYGVGRFLLG